MTTPRTDHIAGEWVACETVPASFARELERDNARLREAINAFCSGQAWADESWKNQPHIKALFDLSNSIIAESSPQNNP
jgi:hypothetical protein